MSNITLKIAIFLTLIYLINSQFDTSRLRIIDQNQGHFLVRGNLPIQDNKFQFETLYKSLSALTGMKTYRLVIYSLLNLLTAKQTKNRYIQQNHFNRDGEYQYDNQYHYYYNHDIIGSYFSPAQYPQFLKRYAIKYYNFTTYDKIPLLLSRIQRNMNSPLPTVVYVHCSQGIDRAGYVAAAYKMKNFGIPFADVIQQNLSIMSSVREHIHFNSFNGMQWYCLYLKRTQEECLVGVQGANRGNTLKSETKGGEKQKVKTQHNKQHKDTHKKKKQKQL